MWRGYGKLTHMQKTTLYLDEDVHQKLKSISGTRVSFSEHVRRALDRYLRDMGGFDDWRTEAMEYKPEGVGIDGLAVGDDAT